MRFRHKFEADGNSNAFYADGRTKLYVFNHGTDGGGTLKLQVSAGNGFDDATERWFDVTSASWTAEAAYEVTLAAGKYRFNLNGATDPELVVAVSE